MFHRCRFRCRSEVIWRNVGRPLLCESAGARGRAILASSGGNMATKPTAQAQCPARDSDGTPADRLELATRALVAREAENRALIASQAASSEVLKAISASPDDTQPVFDLIARHARELCDAEAVGVVEYDGTLMHMRAMESDNQEAADRLRQAFPRPPGPELIAGRAVLAKEVVHLRDASTFSLNL